MACFDQESCMRNHYPQDTEVRPQQCLDHKLWQFPMVQNSYERDCSPEFEQVLMYVHTIREQPILYLPISHFIFSKNHAFTIHHCNIVSSQAVLTQKRSTCLCTSTLCTHCDKHKTLVLLLLLLYVFWGIENVKNGLWYIFAHKGTLIWSHYSISNKTKSQAYSRPLFAFCFPHQQLVCYMSALILKFSKVVHFVMGKA